MVYYCLWFKTVKSARSSGDRALASEAMCVGSIPAGRTITKFNACKHWIILMLASVFCCHFEACCTILTCIRENIMVN